MNSLTIRKADDMHLHLRQDQMLKNVLPHTTKQCARAVIMPNTLPPIVNDQDLVSYKKSIQEALEPELNFTPLMTFKIVASTTPEVVSKLKAAGAVAGKLYPEGVTTNSEDGVKDFESLFPVYRAMEENGLILCLHGEAPGTFCLDREEAFLPTLTKLQQNFPSLKIVLEHITTAKAVQLVESLPENIGATITVHHLRLTLDDVIGDKINPHHFCKPIAKRPEDREELKKAATSGNPKFFLGTDSAPHPIGNKECGCGAAGVYNSAVILPVLAEIFESLGVLERLEAFTSQYGAQFYDLPLNKEKISLIKESWTVPDKIEDIIPFMAGQSLSWKVV